MAVEYIGNGNPSGTCIGKASTEKVAFYGTTPVVQASHPTACGTTTTTIAAWCAAIETVLVNLGLIAAS